MEQYFIYKATPETGLGHNLRSILAYANYADKWGRTLCLDMRHLNYFKDDPHGQFFSLFEVKAPSSLRISIDIPLIEQLYQDQNQITVSENDAILQRDSDTPILYCNVVGRFNPKVQKIPNYSIQLKGHLREEIDVILSKDFRSNKVIGVHFRHGNGEFLHGRFDAVQSKNYKQKFNEVKNQYVEEISRVLKKTDYHSAKIFVASDNMEFVNFIKQQFSQAFSIVDDLPDKPFIEHIKQTNFDLNILKNAVIDMWALSNSNYLICTKSLFTEFAIENSHILHSSDLSIIQKYSLGEILDENYEPMDINDTIHTLRIAVKKMPTDGIKRRLAHFLSKTGKQNEADDILNSLNQSSKILYTKKYNENITKSIIHSGDIQNAIQRALDDIKKHQYDPEIYLHLATLYMRVGEVDRALLMYEELVKLDAGKIGYYLFYSQALARKGQLEDALDKLQEAIDINANSAWLYYHKSDLLFKLKRYPETIEYCNKTIEINPRYASAYSLLSQAYAKIGNDELVLSNQLKSLELEPDNPWILHQCGKQFHELGDYKQAVEKFKKAIVLNTNEAHYHDSLGRSFEALGNLDEALAAQNSALEVAPNNPWMQNRCGHLLARLERIPEAIDKLQQAVTLAPENQDFKDKLKNILKTAKSQSVKTYTIPLNFQSGFGKAKATNQLGRFREIISDPLNFAIKKDSHAGMVDSDNCVFLHNGLRVPFMGAGSYYGNYSSILTINRGVHEPLEEFVFQEVINQLETAPIMLELGAYWGHYSMWLKAVRPAADVTLVEPELDNIQAGKENFKRNNMHGEFIQAFVGHGQFQVDNYLKETGIKRLSILHSDIQGYEMQMLQDCSSSLSQQLIDFLFVSTHSQQLHQEVLELLSGFDYRIEVSSDYEETTSYDGFILASSPERKAIFNEFKPMTRPQITQVEPEIMINYLSTLKSIKT